jgi:hypothetical protein
MYGAHRSHDQVLGIEGGGGTTKHLKLRQILNAMRCTEGSEKLASLEISCTSKMCLSLYIKALTRKDS